MNFKEENNVLLNSFWNRVLFKKNKNINDEIGFELYFGTHCDLKCKYCYSANYGKRLYPENIQKPKNILLNLGLFLDWLTDNIHRNYRIDLFGGEPFSQNLGFDCLKLILDKLEQVKNKPKCIIIPTNYTFLLSDERTEMVENFIKGFKKIGVPIMLSASFDGKYCEKNRPFKLNKEMRDDKYYEKVFAFNKKYNFGFHPMIYSESIKDWKKNFLWFVENFKKYDIPLSKLYLLEVRNANWNKEQINKFADFITFLIKWTFNNFCKKDINKFLDFLFKEKGYNILHVPLANIANISKGITCALQENFCIRLGDLVTAPCHRTFYDPFILAKFVVKKNKIIKIEAKNPELAIATRTFDVRSSLKCEFCPIKYLCSGGCLGSQFETTGDLFSPIPTVCQLEHAKIYAMMKAYKELGVYNKIYCKLNKNKRNSLDILDEIMEKIEI